MRPRDLRDYARQTTVRLAVGGVLLLIIVGEALIYAIYGPSAAVSGLLCFGIGLVPLVATLAVLWTMDWIVRRANKQ